MDTWFKNLAGKKAGKYVLDRYVGSGKLGHVYQGHSEESPDWAVAIKLTPGSPREGWKNEIRKAQQLRGIPGVVAFHDLGDGHIEHHGRTEVFLFTVWDYIPPGRNLRQYLKEIDTCPASFLIAVLEQILRVLHACEKKSSVKRHGDLHPGNILVGDKDEADLDASLETREPIYISDFGYGVTGGQKIPKDDYQGLADIADAILDKTEWERATATDKQIVQGIKELLQKLLKEKSQSERRTPKEILKAIRDLDQRIRAAGGVSAKSASGNVSSPESQAIHSKMSVGQYQVSEMLGDDWERWRSLFVSSVPAKSRILEPDMSTVVTGPRGCGKTMLFRRLSERLVVECGPVDAATDFVGFYINANDIADAFSSFQKRNKSNDEKLFCYANLSILSDLLAIQSARCAGLDESCTEELLNTVAEWLIEEESDQALVFGENRLEHYRFLLERIKWRFPKEPLTPQFPGVKDFSQHTWLPRLFSIARTHCPWMNSRPVFIFVDDYTTPRISVRMQHVLNRLFFQRSSEFVCKLATESATTFIPIDSSGKMLQDGDDYQLIDMGEESLFMSEPERMAFLENIFERRLSLDSRLPPEGHTLSGLLGTLGLRKLQFARLLRHRDNEENQVRPPVSPGSQRRGASRPKALYCGREVFADLWSGDTRTMIQLIQELVDTGTSSQSGTPVPIDTDLQDSVLRRRGGQWLDAQSRNQPTDRTAYKKSLKNHQAKDPKYQITGGSYGAHLKAVVEAFVKIARQLLVSPMYKIQRGQEFREVPRMAFRIEVTDDFRIEGLAAEIYKDLIRYGMFMRDARGKSVRGAFVPRLYLRRLLLPYATLALSKRDSVQMSCDWFQRLLLEPDKFREEFTRYVQPILNRDDSQQSLAFDSGDLTDIKFEEPEEIYNDIDPDDFDVE